MDDSELEVSGPGGLAAKAKGYRLVDLVWLPMCLGISYISLISYQHEATAQQDKAAIARSLSESNATIAAALRESNANTVQAIREITLEQRRSTVAMKEVACLNDPTMKNRGDARDFCRRMARDQ